jgi:SPP1 gp7 family putative phage head morphogenesis protein|uniref:Minor capsid protein n=2 Tax=unclassified Caudoviricetes TaxID=2788787 RepID=A0A8S5M376_9CAUD|nr:MAG TPA: minor capsid protein [Siphoviridae sp. ctQJR51]DAD76691.1 MAG TPA: minor capsid protein [Siphoviridae sp. ctQJR51]DAF96514.1 MAG TPA: minor capsid protein [Siphoviridae sp. ctHj524]DAF96523.1 MAG TPA: minor capsid protein [Siphoviridae sp. ctHj524]
MTRSAEYWKRRAEANMDGVQRGAEQRLARLGRAYHQAARELEGEVQRILGTYAKRFDLTPEEAAAALREPADEESRAYGYRVSRAEALEKAIRERLNGLGARLERETAAQREWTASKSYQSARKMMLDMTGGVVSQAVPDLQGMLRAMDTAWSGRNYSARIWRNTDHLAQMLEDEIEAAFLSGKSVRRMANVIMERFGVGYRAAECLVRTETSYVQNRTAARSYEDAGCTEYEVLTAQDRRTCQYCAKQNGKRYLLATMQAGENAPPFHPNCRCTVLPVVGEDKQLAKKAGPEELGFAVATPRKSGIIKADRVISGHSTTPRKAEPNVVIDHVDENGSVKARGFYDADGVKEKDIHTTNHGNPKRHPYGEHGEHIHEYMWDANGKLLDKVTRNLSDDERKRNRDIL